MIVLVCYDVSTEEPAGDRRLRRIAEACKDYGTRVQYSVFECRIGQREWLKLRERLLGEYAAEEDSLRFYFLCDADAGRTEHHGVRPPLDPTAPLIL